MWRIEFNELAEQALLNLDKPVRQRIIKFLRERVEISDDPTAIAERLSGELRGLWRFRVGDYRIIFDLDKVIRIVEVLDIGHRSRIYRKSGS